ncbi:hypothetical protein Tsubulata_020787 [Turnera subulata]|uniref:RING-type E3 ubiquitin transferase n=1 Tax=Turnera subulata TaxID=218843 RepID=A0A9Q0FHC8_9ROSI|nr:hypothetical protein Tsubulata_020787 [Turnera subulata]
MNQQGVLIIISLNSLWFHVVKAQNTTNSGAGAGALNPLHPSFVVVIGIIAVMFSLTFLILAYAKFCGRSRFDIFDDDPNPRDLNRSRSRLSGIDQTVIDSLPFFRFSSLKGSKEGLECAVCISRFEDSEILRLLPKCRHAFHTNCIDQWLQHHSSCPLCRYKFDPKDLKNFAFSNSLRFLQNPSNLVEEPNLEIIVQREQDRGSSSRFNLGSSFRGNEKGNKQEFLIVEGRDEDSDGVSRKILHKFKHKIIVSDIVIKNRWSDVNSSDLLSLNSEMLAATSSNRFSPSDSGSSRFYNGLCKNENMEKIKEDMERKRVYESKLSRVERSNSLSSLRIPSNNAESSSKIINPDEKRSVSEIINFSRFRASSGSNSRSREPTLPRSNGREQERIRRLWLPIARRTVQWFAGRERNSEELEYKRQASIV